MTLSGKIRLFDRARAFALPGRRIDRLPGVDGDRHKAMLDRERDLARPSLTKSIPASHSVLVKAAVSSGLRPTLGLMMVPINGRFSRVFM